MRMWDGRMRRMLARMTTKTASGSTRSAPRATRAAVATVAVCTLSLAGVPTAGSASASSPAGASPSKSLARTAPASAPVRTARTASTSRAATTYVAVVAKGTTRTLVLVSRSSGKVVRTLGSEKATDIWEPFRDVDLAPDGTVWAVVQQTRPFTPYGTMLRQYTGTRVRNVLPYATSVRASADSRQLAVTVLSPDGNHDGKGTQSLRVITPRGKVVRTLASMTFPVDTRGWPTVEVGGLHVSGWLNPAQLVVGDGCCDSGSSAVVPALKPSRYGSWPAKNGDGSLQAIGIINSKTYLVGGLHWSGTGQANDPLRATGVDAFAVTATRPNGRLVASVTKADANLIDYVDTLVARAKAVPWLISTKRFPYRGTGTVVRAFL